MLPPKAKSENIQTDECDNFELIYVVSAGQLITR